MARFARYLWDAVEGSTKEFGRPPTGRRRTAERAGVTAHRDASRSPSPGRSPRERWPSRPVPGTGKTFALADLATRFIAEGRISASELLIVTFTRAATGELRARVRDRLVVAAGCLSGQRR